MRNNSIAWKNIYYMLTYAIDELKHMINGKADTEECKSLDGLLAILMQKALELLHQNKFLSEYIKIREFTDKPHGNILMEKSYESGRYAHGEVCCEYFALNIDSECNRAIKAAIVCLLNYGRDISQKNRVYLEDAVDSLSQVTDIDADSIEFDDIDYMELPDWYKPAIVASKLIIEELLGTDNAEKVNFFKLDDTRRLKYIFEEFVRNFYTKEYKNGITSHPKYSVSSYRQNRLDMLIENKDIALVIDAKWYTTINSMSNSTNNKREVLDYCLSYKKHESESSINKKMPFGIILYADTTGETKMLYNRETIPLGDSFGECTLYDSSINLNQDFELIKNDLIDLADKILK